jgi:acyl-CoA synthetase (AMP-forming)/AMP-acid ligase II
MIKTRGANVSRLEVEAALVALPGVEAAIVAGLPHGDLGQLIVAAVVPEKGEQLSEDALKAALRKQLSSFKVPRNIVFIDVTDIPRTATGKIRLVETAGMIAARIEEREAPGFPA